MNIPADIITCNDWGARPAKHAIMGVGSPDKAIFHHTESNAPGSGVGRADACALARIIQTHHMNVKGWADSGHNFLVSRGGWVLEGRHGSIVAIKSGLMVQSAHCYQKGKPNSGQNNNPGVEHEHIHGQRMTHAQLEASIALFTWLCKRGGFGSDRIYPHSTFVDTECPSDLAGTIPALRKAVALNLKDVADDAPSDQRAYRLWFQWATGSGYYERHEPFKAPRPNVISPAPREWFREAIRSLVAEQSK